MTFVQNADRNIGPANYGLLTRDQLLITKIFRTHQGEGPFAGRHAIFLRLAGCNRGAKLTMGCMFCDTDFRFDQGKPMRFHEIKHEIEAMFVGETWRESPILVITGGEPMMQHNLLYFLEFAKSDMGAPVIQIESNGDALIPNFPDDPSIFLVVSPKANKNGYHPLKPEVAKRANALKFLIEADPESIYYDIPHEQIEPGRPILLSPITVYKNGMLPGMPASAWDADIVDHAETAANYRRAAKLALERGFRLSMQTHLFFQEE